ncbi:MAG: Cof-type HAD-IIB family hydrolase [Coprobacillus sp.]
MIKAIFFDIDGTLLSHSSRSVPKSTVKALQELKEKGIYTFIATGRHVSEMNDLPIQDLEFEGYITLNGQYCYNEKEVIYDLPIHQDDINNILQLIEEKPFPCIFVEDQLMYINYHNDAVQVVQDAISTPLPDINDLTRGYTHPIYQVIPYDITASQEQDILDIMPHSKRTRWHELAIDIIPSNGGKQNGIHEILKHYHIKQEETMAFGDGHNDIDMFEYVNLAIAMGNADETVKAAADDITDDIDHDGIYNALKKYQVI